MKVLFVVSELFYSEPLGVMMLSAGCKKAGHATRLASIKDHDLAGVLQTFQPDVVAYSAMTTDEPLFRKADDDVLAWKARAPRRLLRIMGGPHPTYFPEVLDAMKLDAVCIGEGDHAMLRVLEAWERGGSLDGIPNIATPSHRTPAKEVIDDLDALPWADRDLLYEASPDLLKVGIRSFLTRRGCPYQCTYCFNHAYIQMFKGEKKKLIRRRSVDDVLAEIKHVVAAYPKARFLRFGDDVFVIRKDEWLETFAERYPKEVGIPFYCLIRASSLSEEVAALLRKAGCYSIAMSIEAGDEKVRNEIMKRNMPDSMLEASFATAKKFGLNAYSNTILGVPGTTVRDDFRSYLFAKKLAPAAPSFTIFWPFPRTDLANYAQEIGVLDRGYDFGSLAYSSKSVLNNYTEAEKRLQLRLVSLAPLFCKLPAAADRLLQVLIRLPLAPVYQAVGALFWSWNVSSKCFPDARPRDPVVIAKSLFRTLRFMLK